ncbi:hypothetical protein BJX99DRAFT_219652 [Aspergillus californicus]
MLLDYETKYMNWPAGPMARRLTTNQEIAGFLFCSLSLDPVTLLSFRFLIFG